MALVHRDGSFQRIVGSACHHPIAIVPGVVDVPHYRGSPRRLLMKQPEGIGFIHLVAMVIGFDVKLVEGSFADARDEAFPDARVSARTKAVHLRMPVIETANDRDFTGVWGPHAEAGADFTARVDDVGTHSLVDPVVRALVEEVQILFGEQRDIVADGAGSGFDGWSHRFSGAGLPSK